MDLNYYTPDVQHRPKGWSTAFTLIELLITVAIMGILSAIAVPVLTGYLNDSRNAKAKADIATIESQIERFKALNNDTLPNSFAAASIVPPLDPWGRQYQYLRIEGLPPADWQGDCRRDKSNNPLNADYDISCIGANGVTTKNIDTAQSADDIIRANNGAFIDLATDY